MKRKEKKETMSCAEIFRANKGHPVKILLSFYEGQFSTLLKTTIFRILQQSPVWVIPIVTANIINCATTPAEHSVREILINAAILLVFLLQNIYSTYSVSRVYDKFVRKTEHTLRSSLIEKLQMLSVSYHKNNSSGKLLSKIMRDCENVELIMSQIFRYLIPVVLDMSIAIYVTLKNSPIVVLFFLVFIPLEIVMVRGLAGSIRKRNQQFRKEIEKTQSNVSEMLELVPVTRAHGLQNREIHKMDKRFDNVMNVGYELDKKNSTFSAYSWVLMQIAQLTCLTFTGMLAYKGKISVGEVVLYQTYFSQIINSVNTVINMYPQITKGLESVNSIGEIFYDDNIEINNSIIPLDNMQGKVDFKEVDFRYEDGGRLVLNNFNVSVKAGESIAFVGGSGAGKSTILNLLIGFDRPCGGRILIDGINMLNLDLNQFRSNIAVVPQNTILFSGTVRDNITYGIDNVTDEQLEKVIKDVGLEDVIAQLPNGINSYLGEHGGNLSGGQRQRISIARALLRNPKIIIFDEATSALDSESEKKVQNAVDNMMKHCTTFLVAHRLSTIKNADRIAVIENGSISEIGTYEELMELHGAFYHLKKLQE